MSTSKPSTRSEFKEYCLMELGKPVIQINVADSQVENMIDQSIQYWQLNHYDGSMQTYLPVTITQDAINNKYFDISDDIIIINNVVEASGYTNGNYFNAEWQMLSSTYPYGLTAGSMLTYEMAQQYYAFFRDNVGTRKKSLNFNRVTSKLFLNVDWSQYKVGDTLLVDGSIAVNPDTNPLAWNDPFLKRYATALIQRQWGRNLRKLKNIKLMGGVEIDAEGILSSAENDIKELEDEMINKYQEPPFFDMG